MLARGTPLTVLACSAALLCSAALVWLSTGGDPAAGVLADVGMDGTARTPSAPPRLDVAVAARGGAQRGCRLSGAVFGPDGPLAARVRLVRGAPPLPAPGRWAEGARLVRALALPPTARRTCAETVAGPDGEFTLEDLPTGSYVVEADENGLSGGVAVIFHAPGQRERVTVRLARADQRLEGRARWADGTPFVGTLRIANFEGSTPAHAGSGGCVCRALVTGVDGRFRAGGLAPGWLCLTAYLDGTWRARGWWVLLPVEGPVEYVVDGAGQRAAGVVVDETTGTPMEGATVQLLRRGDGGHEQSAVLRTGPDGTFTCPWGGGWASQVVIEAPGFARRSWPWVGFTQAFTFGLRRAACLVGRATEETGGPASGIRLRLLGCPLAGSAVTDADGRYRFEGLPEGEVVVTTEVGQGRIPKRAYGSMTSSKAVAENYDSTAVDLRAGETATLDLVLQVGAAIRGRVVDAEARPVVGLGIRLRSQADERAPWSGWDAPPQVVSDDQGGFTVDGLLAGYSYVATVMDPTGNSVEAEGRALGAAEEAEILELVLPPAAVWRVSVVDALTGAPVAGAQVGASTSGKDGVAQLGPLRDEGAQVSVAAPGYVDRADVRLTAAAEPRSASVSLWPGRWLPVRVRLADGTTPKAGFVLLAVSSGAQPDWRSEWLAADAQGALRVWIPRGPTLGGSGYARVEGTPWRCEVSVAPEVEVLEVVLARGETPQASAEAAPRGGLRVRVLDPDGEVVPQVTIRAAPGGLGQQRREDGAVCFEREADPDVELDIYDARDAQGLSLGLAPVHLGPLGEVSAELVVRLERERTLAGMVLGPDGRPVAGVAVRAVPERVDDGRLEGALPIEHARARSDASGRFVLRGLADEAYVLRFAPPRHLCAPRRVVAAPGRSEVEVRLRAAVEAVVRVVDDAGQVVAGAEVRVARRSGRSSGGWGEASGEDGALENVAQGRTGVDGTVALGNLDPGVSYALGVCSPGAESGVVDEEDLLYRFVVRAGGDPTEWRMGWRAADVTVTVRGMQDLRGTVRDEHGEGVAGATVFLAGPDGSWTRTTAGFRGRFAFRVAPGTTVTLAAAEGSALRPGAAARRVRAEAGAQDVVVPLQRGGTLVVRVDGEDPPDPEAWRNEMFWFNGESQSSRTARLVPQGEHALAAPTLEVESVAGLEFRGLVPGAVYTLEIWGGNDGGVAEVEGMRAGDEPLDVTLAPGHEIRGRIDRPAKVTTLRVRAVRTQDGLAVRGRVDPDGRYTIGGLFAGTWSVTATGEDEDGDWEATTRVEAGGRADLFLRPR